MARSRSTASRSSAGRARICLSLTPSANWTPIAGVSCSLGYLSSLRAPEGTRGATRRPEWTEAGGVLSFPRKLSVWKAEEAVSVWEAGDDIED